MARTVVFTGPSLHPAETGKLTKALVLPPIKRGDLSNLKSFDPEVIGIIDGEFYQSLAVSPKEILPFLERGVHVYGAASMGALRAVELEKFGMRGIGRVFRLFRIGFFDAEDEIALTYDPETYYPVSEPLVDTRYALRAAVKAKLLVHEEAQALLMRLKAEYFPQRTRRLLARLAGEILGSSRAAALTDSLSLQTMGIKESDARALIGALNVSDLSLDKTLEEY